MTLALLSSVFCRSIIFDTLVPQQLLNVALSAEFRPGRLRERCSGAGLPDVREYDCNREVCQGLDELGEKMDW